jgi:S1-C subfamily serine protease
MLVICRVTLADQSTYDAKVVGFDQDKDVAVLRVDAPKDKLRPIPVGVSADLLVGHIGNPVRFPNQIGGYCIVNVYSL